MVIVHSYIENYQRVIGLYGVSTSTALIQSSGATFEMRLARFCQVFLYVLFSTTCCEKCGWLCFDNVFIICASFVYSIYIYIIAGNSIM